MIWSYYMRLQIWKLYDIVTDIDKHVSYLLNNVSII